MRTILPGVQGLSSSNLRYMKKFYELYSDPILPQFVEENNILAKYAVNSSKEPIGISEYKLSNLLPVEYRASMPTIEEIENELR